MNVKILSGCLINGEHCGEGEIVDLDDATAKQMISYGRAAEATKADVAEAAKAAKKAE